MNINDMFGMILQIDSIKEKLATSLEGVTPDYLIRGASAMGIEFVLQQALNAGPPEGFAEKLQMEPEPALALYNHVLRAALTRKA